MGTRVKPGLWARASFAGRLSAGILSLFLAGCSSEPPQTSLSSESDTPQAALTELVRVDGLLHRDGEIEPFTGFMVEFYPDGVLKSRSAIRDGLMHGVSEGWYPNGVLEIREYFSHGTSHGDRQRWYDDGTLHTTAEIVDGKLHGIFQRWHANGVLGERIEMKNGEAHGVSEAYFPSGYLRAYAEMDEGRILRQESWPDGEVRGRPLH